MNEFNSHQNSGPVSPPRLLPLLQDVKTAYLLWFEYYQTIPKAHRHTLGQQIENLWVEIIKTLTTASFLPRQEKLPYVRSTIQKADSLKILLMILWEAGSLQNPKYIALSVHIDVIGKKLGGWNGQLTKQNSPESAIRQSGKK